MYWDLILLDLILIEQNDVMLMFNIVMIINVVKEMVLVMLLWKWMNGFWDM